MIEEGYKENLNSLLERLETVKHLFDSKIDWWEGVKKQIKTLTKTYCKDRKDKERRKNSFLETLLEEAKERNRDLYIEIKKQLQTAEKKKYEGKIVRGKGKNPIDPQTKKPTTIRQCY